SSEQPDIIHNFTIKCVVYGSLATRLANVKGVINAVAGLGYIFTSNQIKARILRPLVRRLLKFALDSPRTRLILQNTDDCVAFESAGLINVDRIRLIRGSGVDTVHFHPSVRSTKQQTPFKVLLAARLLWDKGIREYVDAAKIIKNAGLPIE